MYMCFAIGLMVWMFMGLFINHSFIIPIVSTPCMDKGYFSSELIVLKRLVPAHDFC